MVTKINGKPIQVKQDEDKPSLALGILHAMPFLFMVIPMEMLTRTFMGVSLVGRVVDTFPGTLWDIVQMVFSWLF